MDIKETIQLAVTQGKYKEALGCNVESGSVLFSFKPEGEGVFWKGSNVPVAGVLIDLLFWQSLGKALGWKWKAYKDGRWITEEEDLRMMSDTPFRYPEWEWQWLQFISHLAEGKSAEEYFKSL